MTEVSVSIPHRMRPEQTLSRLKAFATGAKREYGDLVHISREVWSDRGCDFALTLSYRGKRAVIGSMWVDASHVHLRGRADFPARLRTRVERRIAIEVSRLLTKVRSY